MKTKTISKIGMQPEEKYMRDAEFHALVDLLEAAIYNAQYTPSEIREAAILAATHYELRRIPEMRTFE